VCASRRGDSNERVRGQLWGPRHQTCQFRHAPGEPFAARVRETRAPALRGRRVTCDNFSGGGQRPTHGLHLLRGRLWRRRRLFDPALATAAYWDFYALRHQLQPCSHPRSCRPRQCAAGNLQLKADWLLSTGLPGLEQPGGAHFTAPYSDAQRRSTNATARSRCPGVAWPRLTRPGPEASALPLRGSTRSSLPPDKSPQATSSRVAAEATTRPP